MNTFTKKSGQSQRSAAADGFAKKESDVYRTRQLADERPAAVTQRALGESLNRSDKVQSQLQLQRMFDQSPRVTAQMKLAEVMSARPSALQPQPPVQRQEMMEEEEPLQGKFVPLQREELPEGHIILRKKSGFKLQSDAGQSAMDHQPGIVVQRALSVDEKVYTPQQAWENLAGYDLDISESGALRVLAEWAADNSEFDDWDGVAEDLEEAGYNEEIEGEMVYIELDGNNEEEQKEQAADMMMTISLTYGINLSSSVTPAAISKSLDLNRAEIGEQEYEKRQKKLRNTTTDSWTLEELEALLTALSRFGNILGSKRASSPRANVPQEIVTFGKFAEDIDLGGTLAETFIESRHITLYEEGTTESGGTPDKEDITQTLIHELTHGLLEHRLKDFENSVSYWKWIKNEERKERLNRNYVRGEFEGDEEPPTAVAEQSAAEDLAESTAMYLYSKESKKNLRDNYPERYYIVGKIIKEEMGA